MIFAQLFYIIAILGGLYGCFVVFQSVNGLGVDNVMQQIARVTFAMSYAMIPYVIARSIDALVRGEVKPETNIVYVPQQQERQATPSGSTAQQFKEESFGEWRTNPLTGKKQKTIASEEIKGKWGD